MQEYPWHEPPHFAPMPDVHGAVRRQHQHAIPRGLRGQCRGQGTARRGPDLVEGGAITLQNTGHRSPFIGIPKILTWRRHHCGLPSAAPSSMGGFPVQTKEGWAGGRGVALHAILWFQTARSCRRYSTPTRNGSIAWPAQVRADSAQNLPRQSGTAKLSYPEPGLPAGSMMPGARADHEAREEQAGRAVLRGADVRDVRTQHRGERRHARRGHRRVVRALFLAAVTL